MQLDHRPSKVLVTGRSGTGKTTYWTKYLLGSAAALKFVFDHEGEMTARLKVTPAVAPAELADQVATGWVIYDPSVMFPGRLLDGFNFFAEFAFTLSTRIGGRKLFACDELQKLVGTMNISPQLALVLETGRRYGLDAVMISQQPNLIHNRIRNQLTELVTFAQMDGNAMKFLEEAGFDCDRVRRLRPGEWIARNLTSGGESRGRVF